MGEACCTAIETLHILHDENLLTNAAEQGKHLLNGLRWLHRRHPKLIRDVRGSGLMAAIEFADLSGCLPGLTGRMAGMLDQPLRGSVAMLATVNCSPSSASSSPSPITTATSYGWNHP
ncbi:aminotransferase class III-fold pyridoxal phosphate-dependent enzyme [Saccharopolyspora spinosa]|uniref:aminotransferase class III-fold pyridoxal phosphate-dependent enzyme n=1 Tax=Saccharopolyspora spinosa TaxID=60894 RepID=UPI003748F696